MTEKTVNEYYEITFPFSSLKDVMKVLKEENLGQSEQMFDLECRLKLNFRVSIKEKVFNRLSRIEGVNYRYIDTY
jgi:hypothetical protein